MYNLVCYLNSTSTVHWFIFPCVCCCTLIAKGASIISIEYSCPFPSQWMEWESLLPLLQAAVTFSSWWPQVGHLRKSVTESHSMNLIFLFSCEKNFLISNLLFSKKKVQYHTSSVSNISISINGLNVDTVFFLYISSKLLIGSTCDDFLKNVLICSLFWRYE